MNKLTLPLQICWALTLAVDVGSAQQLGTPPLAENAESVQTSAQAQTSIAVNPNDRASAVQLYQSTNQASQGIAAGWTGNRTTCTAGTTSQAYADATILRVNYFRAMAGLPSDVILTNTWNPKAQEAALMMSAQKALS